MTGQRRFAQKRLESAIRHGMCRFNPLPAERGAFPRV